VSLNGNPKDISNALTTKNWLSNETSFCTTYLKKFHSLFFFVSFDENLLNLKF